MAQIEKLDPAVLEAMSMEEAYANLDALLEDMERNEHSLEETFALYTQGLS